MVAYDQIEKLKSEYTDKWVSVVDENTPELSRYHDRFGQVKTVNMNGRALVEFHGGVDTGWIDIDLNYLKVVEKPDFEAMEKEKKAKAKATPKAKPAAKKPATTGPDGKKLSPLEMARQQGAKKKEGGAKQSTADILAAARGKGGAAKPAKEESPKPSGGKMSTADILAAARAKKEGEAAAAPQAKAAEEKSAAKAAPAKEESPKPSGGKMSTADILAAARAKGGDASAKEETPDEPEPVEEPAAEEVVVEEAPAKDEAPAAESAKPSGDLPKDIPGILEYCRKADTN